MYVTITVEDCKPDSYVGCPMPKVDLPECEYGWDLGNGTAVCATQPAPSAPLAATGADLGLTVGCWLLAAALICGGLALVRRSRRQ